MTLAQRLLRRSSANSRKSVDDNFGELADELAESSHAVIGIPFACDVWYPKVNTRKPVDPAFGRAQRGRGGPGVL